MMDKRKLDTVAIIAIILFLLAILQIVIVGPELFAYFWNLETLKHNIMRTAGWTPDIGPKA